MASLKTFAVAAAALAVLASSNVRAADLPALLPPPIEEYGGWYLRGDIGMSNQRLKGLEHPLFETATDFVWLDKGGFDSAPFFGLGIGYEHNNWFRWDITGEYRGKADFHALDQFDNGGTINTNDYTGSKSEWLFLFNAYLDLGTWKSITPFVGAGIGATRNTISHFKDTNVIGGAGGFADTGSKWDLAWALYAGLSYEVTPSFTVEFAYRYLNLGDAKTGDFRNDDPGVGCQVTPPCFPVQFKGITSHDIKFGVRWMLADMGVSHWQPPIVTKY
ncbi:MAG: outer membrane beta-barrel protein [Xanthobacteraceae bacterium]